MAVYRHRSRVRPGLKEVHVVGHNLAAHLDHVAVRGHGCEACAVDEVQAHRKARLVDHEPDLLERADDLDTERADVRAVGVVARRIAPGGAQGVLLTTGGDSREGLAAPGVRVERAAHVEHEVLVHEQQVVAALGPSGIVVLGDLRRSHDLVPVRLVSGRENG